MAKDPTEARLKLIHLVYGLIAAGVVLGIAIGSMGKQQTINTDDIQKVEMQKVEKEVFEQHQAQQQRTFKRMDEGFKDLGRKIDAVAEKL